MFTVDVKQQNKTNKIQNNLAQLFSLKGRIAILNFCRGRLKVKVTLGGRSGGGVVDNMLDYESRDH